jgi:hypothetical protein
VARLLGNRRRSFDLHNLHPGFSGRIRFELRVVLDAEEMRVEKISPDQRLDDCQRFWRREILRDVSRRVPPHERQIRSRLQVHGPDKEILQRSINAAMLAQRELRKRAIANCRAKQGEEAITGGRLRHAVAAELGANPAKRKATSVATGKAELD